MRARLLIGFGLFTLLAPVTASAHAMGDVFALNLPFRYLALGAAVALFYSFAAFLVFSDAESIANPQPPRTLIRIPSPVVIVLRMITAIAFTAAITFGFFRDGTAASFTPVFLWVCMLLGVAYVSLFIGNTWEVVNPFRALRFARGLYAYPVRLSYLPALVVYVALICVELFTEGAGADPQVVAVILSGYVALTLLGSALFGSDEWFTYGDFFSVFFGFVSRASLISVRAHDIETPSLAAPLVYERARDVFAFSFITFMLASTSFDGVHDTILWHNVGAAIPGIAGLAVLWLLTAALYVGAVQLVRLIAATRASLASLVLAFTYSLIPIAIAYNIAHYFTLLTGPLDTHAVWAVQIAVVIIGHVYATYVAHRIALNEIRAGNRAVLGQIPMLLLMMCFTVFALWILSLGVRAE